MPSLTVTKALVADVLFELGAIKFGAFKLKLHEKHPAAPLSPIYLNLRTANHPKNPGPLTDEVMNLIGDLFWEAPVPDYRCFADIPDAGAPFGNQIERKARENAVPISRLRLHKLILPDGSRHIAADVAGNFNDGASCLVVDELITHADSKLEAIKALEGVGLRVEDVLVLVDRMQGGGAQLKAQGYRLHAVFTLFELLDHYVAHGYINEAKAREVRDYIANNQAA